MGGGGGWWREWGGVKRESGREVGWGGLGGGGKREKRSDTEHVFAKPVAIDVT